MHGWEAHLEDIKPNEILWKMHGRKDIRWNRDMSESDYATVRIANDKHSIDDPCVALHDDERVNLLREKIGEREKREREIGKRSLHPLAFLKTEFEGKWLGKDGDCIRVNEVFRVHFGGIVSYWRGRIRFACCDVVISSVGRNES